MGCNQLQTRDAFGLLQRWGALLGQVNWACASGADWVKSWPKLICPTSIETHRFNYLQRLGCCTLGLIGLGCLDVGLFDLGSGPCLMHLIKTHRFDFLRGLGRNALGLSFGRAKTWTWVRSEPTIIHPSKRTVLTIPCGALLLIGLANY